MLYSSLFYIFQIHNLYWRILEILELLIPLIAVSELDELFIRITNYVQKIAQHVNVVVSEKAQDALIGAVVIQQNVKIAISWEKCQFL